MQKAVSFKVDSVEDTDINGNAEDLFIKAKAKVKHIQCKPVSQCICSTNLCTHYRWKWTTDATTLNATLHKNEAVNKNRWGLYWLPASVCNVLIRRRFDDLPAQG